MRSLFYLCVSVIIAFILSQGFLFFGVSFLNTIEFSFRCSIIAFSIFILFFSVIRVLVNIEVYMFVESEKPVDPILWVKISIFY